MRKVVSADVPGRPYLAQGHRKNDSQVPFVLRKVVNCSLMLNFSKLLRKCLECPSITSIPAFFSLPCFSLSYFRKDNPVPLLPLDKPTSQEELNISFGVLLYFKTQDKCNGHRSTKTAAPFKWHSGDSKSLWHHGTMDWGSALTSWQAMSQSTLSFTHLPPFLNVSSIEQSSLLNLWKAACCPLGGDGYPQEEGLWLNMRSPPLWRLWCLRPHFLETPMSSPGAKTLTTVFALKTRKLHPVPPPSDREKLHGGCLRSQTDLAF